MKMLVLVMTLVSSTALAKRTAMQWDNKLLNERLTNLVGIKMQGILGHRVSVDQEELEKFAKDHLVIDILNGDRAMAMAFLPKNPTSDEVIDFDKVEVSYGSSIEPKGLHFYLVNNLKNENEFTDANIFLLAQYSPRHLAMHEATVTDGEIALGSATYYEIDMSGDSPSVQETALVNVLMENTKGIAEDELADEAFVRLFDYHTQGMGPGKIKKFAAGLAQAFFS